MDLITGEYEFMLATNFFFLIGGLEFYRALLIG